MQTEPGRSVRSLHGHSSDPLLPRCPRAHPWPSCLPSCSPPSTPPCLAAPPFTFPGHPQQRLLHLHCSRLASHPFFLQPGSGVTPSGCQLLPQRTCCPPQDPSSTQERRRVGKASKSPCQERRLPEQLSATTSLPPCEVRSCAGSTCPDTTVPTATAPRSAPAPVPPGAPPVPEPAGVLGLLPHCVLTNEDIRGRPEMLC